MINVKRFLLHVDLVFTEIKKYILLHACPDE